MRRKAQVLEPMSLKRARVWIVILTFYLLGAIAWFWLLPHGFPIGHPRWWANTALPVAVVLASVLGITALVRRNVALVQPILFAIPVAWTAALLTACAIFPFSALRFSIPVLLLAVVFWLAYWKQSPERALKSRGMLVAGVLAIAAGIGLPLTQQSPLADTRPLNEHEPRRVGQTIDLKSLGLVKIAEGVQIIPSDAYVNVKCGGLDLHLNPLLTFASRSPDRCWSSLAPFGYGIAPRRQFAGRLDEENGAFLYQDIANHWLQIRPIADSKGAILDSYSLLAEPVYSHLNSYALVQVHGHKDLALSFSPCPDIKVTVEPSDYPMGRPARFAYLDAAGTFTVVEAQSGEKGPFRILASGPLSSTEELRILLHDSGVHVATIVLADWASQLSTNLSPTAGWEVPMNAIEFLREGDAKTEIVGIWATLAATSIGRGWDSVGHSAGIYRNRILIEAADSQPQNDEEIRIPPSSEKSLN